MLTDLPSLLMTSHLKCRAIQMDKTATKLSVFRGCLRQPLYCFHNAIPSYGFGSRIYIQCKLQYIYIDICIMLTLRWYNNTNIYILAVQEKYYVLKHLYYRPF